MIRNVVFDMGKVLLDYDAVAVCRQYTQDAGEIGLIRRELFEGPEWELLDQGLITEAEAIKRVGGRLADGRLVRLAEECLAHWHEYNLSPVPGMDGLVRDLKQAGYGIYLCSNVSLRFRVFEKEMPGTAYFDGMLISAEEKLVKPDPAIYERLFSRFHLRPEECFFIDDLPANIEAARRCGMDGYCFTDGDEAALREVLRRRLPVRFPA